MTAAPAKMQFASRLADLGPGLAAAAGIAGLAWMVATAGRAALAVPIPTMVAAVVLGMMAAPLVSHARFEPGLTWCVKTLLRWAVALLGLRIALSDIVALGPSTAALVILAMGLTLVAGVATSRALGLGDGYGALVGAANAVCGASATLATATVVPPYPNRAADIAFTVLAANAVSTIVMLVYPPMAVLAGFDARETGILLGGTIQDMAQVVGAGYAVSEATGNTAVVVKLMRVGLLLPVVLTLGWWLTRAGQSGDGKGRVPVPVFAIVFLLLSVLNTALLAAPSTADVYRLVKPALTAATDAGLLLAIAALGLLSSFRALRTLNWRHAVVFLVAAGVILMAIFSALALAG